LRHRRSIYGTFGRRNLGCGRHGGFRLGEDVCRVRCCVQLRKIHQRWRQRKQFGRLEQGGRKRLGRIFGGDNGLSLDDQPN
jgi:hypothetical protein